MPGENWSYNEATKRKVRFSQSSNAWIDEKGRIAGPSAHRREAKARVPGKSTKVRIEETATDSSDAMSRGEASSEDDAGVVYHQATSRPRQYVGDAHDKLKGVTTPWSITLTGNFVDPDDASRKRSLSRKRIGKGNNGDRGKGGKGSKDRKKSNTKENVYRRGTVITAELVPPPRNAAVSGVSAFTPAQASAEVTVRRQKFIVLEEKPNDRDMFRAVAIKTYGGEGVGNEGVIKWHHSQCHTGRDPPRIKSREAPQRSGERAMQPVPIRVKAFDSTKQLDNMSRIDHTADEWYFEHGAQHIKIFGEVHADSIVAFFNQHRNVRQQVNDLIRGAAARRLRTMSDTQTQSSGTARAGPSDTSIQRSQPIPIRTMPAAQHAAPPGSPLPSGQTQARSFVPSASGASPGAQCAAGSTTLSRSLERPPVPSGSYMPVGSPPSHPSRQPAPAGWTGGASSTAPQQTAPTGAAAGTHPGVVSVDFVRTQLQALANYAREQQLPVPHIALMDSELRGLADNPEIQANHLQRIRDGLRRAREATNARARAQEDTHTSSESE